MKLQRAIFQGYAPDVSPTFAGRVLHLQSVLLNPATLGKCITVTITWA